MNRRLASILQTARVLSREEVDSALSIAEQSGRPLRDVVLKDKGVPEERLAEAFASYLRVPYVRLAAATVDAEALKLVPEERARKYECFPMKKEQAAAGDAPGAKRRATLVLAMADPADLAATQEIEFASGCIVKPVVATATEVRDAIARHYASEHWLQDFLKNVDDSHDFCIVGPDEDQDQEADGVKKVRQAPAVKMVNLLIQKAIAEGASDIHIEPTVNHVQVRNRIQGLLREYAQMPKWIQESLVSRIKILAKLDIAERRIPQDGRIKVLYENRNVDLRVSTLPTHFGEKVVLRILGAGQDILPTASLGLRPVDLRILKTASDQPQGLILVTGPTGSGKTTTLYSILSERKNPDINIVTVEDPIEFQLAGVNQVQVNMKAGLTFAASLRSILRQDPDVVLVGEIRDSETAEIAFNAAMTGHLVLTTLHTNSTTAAVGRLLDLGIDPQLIHSSVNLILAQRLLRKLCPQCREIYQPARAMIERLHLEEAGYTYYRGRGCDACGLTGYSGRLGVYEMLRMTPALKELVARKASELELREAAMRAGMVPLLQSALELVREGTTSVEEVLRVIQLQEDEVTRCPKCGSLIDREFASCPYCMHALKLICESCEQELKPDWRICPYCSGPIAQNRGVVKGEAAAVSAKVTDGAQAGTGVPSEAGGQEQSRILVVEDDEVVQAVIAQALEAIDSRSEIIVAASGEEALVIAAARKFDLVLLDLMLPGIDGFEVCRRLRSDLRTAFLPVLMLTASSSEESRTRGFLVGTDDFMAKPISVPELHRRVSRLLRRTYGM